MARAPLGNPAAGKVVGDEPNCILRDAKIGIRPITPTSEISQRSGCDVALVISDLGSGGAQCVLVRLADVWSKAGRRVTVITLADRDQDFFELPSGVGRIALGGVGRSPSLFAGLVANIVRIRDLRAALREAGAPLVIAFIMPTAVLAVWATRGLDVRVIVCERNDPDRQSFGPVWDVLRRLTYRLADVVTANSRGALSALKAYVPEAKLAYVANPLPARARDSEAQYTAPMVLSVGRLNRQKAHDVLLKAFALFAAEHGDWRLAIMGEGPEGERLRDLAQELKIDALIDWLGTQPDPFPWLERARIFSLASRYEGTPNALLEAMSCALPCIVSDASPGPLELIKNEVTGLVVAVETPAALANALDRLASDRALARRLGEAAREWVGEGAAELAMQSWEAALRLAEKRQ